MQNSFLKRGIYLRGDCEVSALVTALTFSCFVKQT